MHQVTGHIGGRERLLSLIEGTACAYCDGTVVRDRYKGNDAAVCEACGTPAVQLW